ncbi:hypothetical protein PLESTB_000899600 [Pleodorina starrii]|uniref:Uncharacterized protein n=1 Tax=Pleodorina starrii TaxID=330485 RepID=A0A9W6BN04_9CHLO|nr:hypothetical protein PLESTB_000899600 [Pleodorina starrii]
MLSLAVLRPSAIAAAAATRASALCCLRAASGRPDQPPQPHTGGLRDDPGHELATGGLYESARKDREAVPSPTPGVITQHTAGQATDTAAPEDAKTSQGMPENSYPVHQDPAASLQHPSEAFQSPAQATERNQPPPADREVEGSVPPSSDVEARPDVHGVTRGPPPEDVQQGQVGVTKPPSREEVRSAQRSFAEHSVGHDLKEPTRGKLDEGADLALQHSRGGSCGTRARVGLLPPSRQTDDELPPNPHTGGLRDDPGHELATGGLYDSFRKDREPLPSPMPCLTWQTARLAAADTAASDGAKSTFGMPEEGYPILLDPAALLQHPSEAFLGPARGP